MSCPSCEGRSIEHLLSFYDLPASGVYQAGLEPHRPGLDLHHVLCTQCGLAFQEPIAHRPEYEVVNRSTARQIPEYAVNLIGELARYGVTATSLIYEIGANDGAFLAALRAAGYENTVGVEPSRTLADEARRRGFRMEAGYFTLELAEQMTAKYGIPSAVVCRHTLEHVEKPKEFLKAIHRCLQGIRDGVVLLEVPDGAAIPELMNVYEFWDEHLYCFGSANLVRLLHACGFEIVTTAALPHLDTRNLVTWCRLARDNAVLGPAPDASALVRSWLHFKREWPRYRAALATGIASAPKPVYFVGASHAQTNFANYLGVGQDIGAMIDDDPAKLGKRPPVKDGSPAIISSADFLKAARAGTLVLTGFGYAAWMNQLRQHAERHGMTILDPKIYAPA